MFDDDFLDDEWNSLDELLQRYEEVKNGDAVNILEEEEFERVIEYYSQNNNEEQALFYY